MRTSGLFVVGVAGVLMGACGGRSELFERDGGSGSGIAGSSGTSGSTTPTGGSTGSFTGSAGFTGGTGNGFTGSVGYSGGTTGGSGFGGASGVTGTFTGSVAGTGFGGSISGSASGITGTTGASGSGVLDCPGPVPKGSTCLDGGAPFVTHWVDTGSQCFTTFDCNPPVMCTGIPPALCDECDGGFIGCASYVNVNGMCEIETCPASPGSSCFEGAECVGGSSCSNATQGDDCALTCICEDNQLECYMECGTPPPMGPCEPGRFCDAPGSTCESANPCYTCTCAVNEEYVCVATCADASILTYFDAGAIDASYVPDASVAHDASFAADATETGE